MLNFIHIPKTAGTSFRLAAEEVFGASRIVYDYGKAAQETSDIVHRHVYEEPDLWAFHEACKAQNAAMVGGHMNCNKFVGAMGVANIVTFVREPLQRIASEFEHFVRVKGYQGSFQEFYSQPKMQNRLTRAFKDVPVYAAGFVGVTERYDESLQMLNALTGMGIPVKQENLGKGQVGAVHEFTRDDLEQLRQLNKQDLRLYRRCLALFEERKELFEQGKPFVHGRLTQAAPKRIAGWAWWEPVASEQSVEVEVFVNGQFQRSVRAVDFMPNLLKIRPPRGGYVGFHLPMSLQVGDVVSCRVHETGQLLGEIEVTEPEKRGR
tara:strand:+ start:30968 stop:31930 length:963 start_codon:yes stop_codon:yes gene_type:complete